MGERAHHEVQVCSGTNPRKCQDLGDSILLLLGSFILLNVGINVVTLLWRHLKNSLRILFHHFFPKDKKPSSVGSHPVCICCSVDPKNLCSRVSSRFHHRPSFLLGNSSHPDSWIPDVNEEKPPKCCWMSTQCRHTGAPSEALWGLWKEEMLGAGETPLGTPVRPQVSFFSRPEHSSQFHAPMAKFKAHNLKMGKLDMAPLPLPQESKRKPPAPTSSPGLAQSSSQSLAQNPVQTAADSTVRTSTQAQSLNPEHISTQTQHDGRPSKPEHPLTSAPDHTPDPERSSTHSYNPEHTPTHTHAQTHSPKHTPAQTQTHSPLQAKTHSPAHASERMSTQVRAFEHTSTNGPTSTLAHAALTHTSPQDPGPTSVPGPSQTFALVPNLAPVQTPATSEVTAALPASNPAPVPVLTSVPTGPSTGHVVYDACRGKEQSHASSPKNCEYPSKDLGTSSRAQEGQDLVSSCAPEQTSKQHSEGGLNPPAGSLLGYLELEKMDWEISNDGQDQFVQPMALPYCNSHPCSSGKKITDAQAPFYPKFLVYSQGPTTPHLGLHSPTTAQTPLNSLPSPCTLSLPLVPPRSFVLPELASCQKPLASIQTPPTLPNAKSPQSIPQVQVLISPQATISQPSTQPQSSELHKSQGLNQDFGLQRSSCLSKDSRIHRKPGLNQDPGLHKHPGLYKGPVPPQGSGYHTSPGITRDSGCLKRATQDTSTIRSPCVTQISGFQRAPGFMRNSGVYRSLNREPLVNKHQGFSKETGPYKNTGPPQDAGGVHGNSNLTQEYGVHKSVDFAQASGLPKDSNLTQDSGDSKNPGLTQDGAVHRNPEPPQDSSLPKSPAYTQATQVNKKTVFAQDVGMNRNPGQTPDPNIHKYLEIPEDPGHREGPALTQDDGLPKTPPLSQKSALQNDPGLCKSPRFALGIDSVPVIGRVQTSKSASSLTKSFDSKEVSWIDTEPQKSWFSVPLNQNASSSKSQTICNDLQTFSEIPVLIELQSSRRASGQDWVHRPMDTVASACQNYRQMSVPPKVNWKVHCHEPGPRSGHVIFDGRQTPVAVGKGKREALSPKRPQQEASGNSQEATKEWGYQFVMKGLDKGGKKVHR
ncbi:uncharacterized protein SPEM3 [Echinops telfairi]|uniref:Uncharacterized protein SPEM3 n=1 Tax=Echinops telfairi TaxID=9371 RepID=A0ABM1VKU3_ECHTE|nr:uncharacterized protein SPEM3 [Echinops telfairi]